MWLRSWWWVAAGVVLLGLLLVQFVRVNEKIFEQVAYTGHAGELIGAKMVGQTFVAPGNYLSGVAVQFGTYSGRNNTRPVQFGLREWGSAEDLRIARVMPAELGDNQPYRFDFDPIADSAGTTYFFYVTSPESTQGNAVTVGIDNRDPYPSGTAFIGDAKAVAKSGKPVTDLAFALYQAVPVSAAAWHWLISWWHNFTFDRAWLPGVLGAVVVTLVWCWADRIKTRRATLGTLGVLFIAALLWRWWYARELPLTNDEGNYLYDAWTLLHGKLAGGDGYVKAPLFIAWIALWQLVAGHTVLAGRMSSVVISSLTLWPVYVLAVSLWNRRTGLVAAALWAVTGVAVVFGIYVHTQPVALFFAVAGIALLAHTVRHNTRAWRFVAAGVLLGLGVASRKSVLAVGLVPLIMLLIPQFHPSGGIEGYTRKVKQLAWVGLGFVVVIALFLLAAHSMYGTMGVREAIGIGSAEDSINTDPAQAEQVRAYSIRGMTPFFRESLPLILLSLIGLGVAGERWARRWVQPVVAKLAWLLPAAIFYWAWWFFFEYEGAVFHRFGILELWYIFPAVLLLLAVWPFDPPMPRLRRAGSLLGTYVVVPLWVFGLVIFYTNWIKFHANYIAEFIPPLVVLSAYGAVALRDRLPRYLCEAVWLVVIGAIVVTGYVTFVFEHTGTFQQEAVAEAAAWAKENIPADQAIFTGAAVVPYVSGQHVALDIAHPRWYAYEFTRKDPVRLNTFLPSAEKMLEAFRKSEWVLMEQQTGFSFLMEYSEIEKSINEDFQAVHVVENGSNTLTFYRRQ